MHRARETGYSLVELAVTVAVVAIVAAVAFPNFQNVIRSNRVSTASNELVASLSLARVEALRSPGGAGLCASADGTTCGTNWNAGWMVWINADNNDTPAGTPEERVLKFVQGRGLLTVTADGGVGTLMFDRRGRIRAGTDVLITISPSDACPAGSQLVRDLTMTAAGQVHVTKRNCE
ncbi:MAG: GspH/FimT family pseudopilin [Proteobacteria bacterium]|nr:GspH/FimT family pseudopilin [Pseudomonadota bacterium]